MADQQYLITSNEHEPFLTDWFIAENNFRPDMGMVVQDKQHTETEICALILMEEICEPSGV